MKKLVILLVVLMLLASACASVGSEMARSEEVVPSQM